MAQEPLQELPFGGRVSRADDNLSKLHEALKVNDCILDYDRIESRPGSRLSTNTALGSGGNSAQGLWRYRPDRSLARTVGIVGGGVNLLTDPSSETTSDSGISNLGTPFGNTDNISGAQLDQDFYIASDNGVAAQRIEWTSPASFALVSLGLYPQGSKPSAVTSTALTWTALSGITPTVSGCILQTNSNTGWSSMPSTWRGFSKTNNGNDDPLTGAYARYKLAANFDATGYDWLLVAVSPQTNGGTNANGEVAIQVAVDSSGTPGPLQTIGVIHDTPQAGGSPNYLFCDIRTLDPTVKSAIRYIQFTLDQAVGGKFMVYGYAFLPARPLHPTETYYVDFFNCSTGEQSPLTDALDVTPGQATVAGYPDAFMNFGSAANTGGTDDPFNAANLSQYCYNVGAGVPKPDISEIGSLVTISGTTSAFGSTALTVRLWKQTDNGVRLVNATSGVNLTCPDTNAVAQNSAYSLTDPGGLGVLSNLLYKAGGTLPQCNALAAHAQRLIAGYQNRLYISSYVPTADNTHPFPQFPSIALEDADGWSFDIAPGKDEQIVGLDGFGDALYIITNKAVYEMSDLRPNSLPYKVFQRGGVSRRGFKYAEEYLFVAAWDGLYMFKNRANPVELSLPIRRLWLETFLPDATTVVEYDERTRSLYIICGTRMLRYSFSAAQGREWSGLHTLPVSVSHSTSWLDPGSSAPQFWMLSTDRKVSRLQGAADRDMLNGTDETSGYAIPDWVFSTGFDFTQQPQKLDGMLLDADGPVLASVAKTVDGTTPDEGRELGLVVPKDGQDEVWIPGVTDFNGQKLRFEFSAASGVKLRRAAIMRSLLDKRGG